MYANNSIDANDAKALQSNFLKINLVLIWSVHIIQINCNLVYCNDVAF